MRIIAGKYKKSHLYTLEGNDTRPTTDALREAIFSSLFDVSGFEVLDLFAGTGAFALEAISRGAKSAVLVDNSYYAVQVIKKNIKKINCMDIATVKKAKVYKFIEECDRKFDLIFLDPPYDKAFVNKTLDLIKEYGIIKENGYIVVEHYFKEDIDPKWANMIVYRKEKGKNRVAIIKFEKNREQKNEDL